MVRIPSFIIVFLFKQNWGADLKALELTARSLGHGEAAIHIRLIGLHGHHAIPIIFDGTFLFNVRVQRFVQEVRSLRESFNRGTLCLDGCGGRPCSDLLPDDVRQVKRLLSVEGLLSGLIRRVKSILSSF